MRSVRACWRPPLGSCPFDNREKPLRGGKFPWGGMKRASRSAGGGHRLGGGEGGASLAESFHGRETMENGWGNQLVTCIKKGASGSVREHFGKRGRSSLTVATSWPRSMFDTPAARGRESANLDGIPRDGRAVESLRANMRGHGIDYFLGNLRHFYLLPLQLQDVVDEFHLFRVP